MNTHANITRIALALLMGSVLLLSACGQVSNVASKVNNNLDFDLGSQPTYYLDEYVRTSSPVVHVHPAQEVPGIKVLFVPFRVTQKMEQGELVGHSVSKVFWQTFAADKVFDYMEYMPEAGPFRRDVALRMARQRGADMVIGGYVTHYFEGTGKLDTTLAYNVEAYDVSSGLLVWSIGHAGIMPGTRTNDYIIFSTKTRHPTSPIYAVNTYMSEEIAQIMKKWSRSDEEENQTDAAPGSGTTKLNQ